MFMQLYYSNFLTLDAGREKICFQNVLKKTKTQLKMLILNQHDFWECLVWNNPLIFWCWCCCQNPVHPRKGLDLFWKFTVHSSFLILNITFVPRYIRLFLQTTNLKIVQLLVHHELVTKRSLNMFYF